MCSISILGWASFYVLFCVGFVFVVTFKHRFIWPFSNTIYLSRRQWWWWWWRRRRLWRWQHRCRCRFRILPTLISLLTILMFYNLSKVKSIMQRFCQTVYLYYLFKSTKMLSGGSATSFMYYINIYMKHGTEWNGMEWNAKTQQTQIIRVRVLLFLVCFIISLFLLLLLLLLPLLLLLLLLLSRWFSDFIVRFAIFRTLF